MANLSNINNKFLVTTTGEVLIGQTSNNGNRLQITGADGASYIYLKTDVATTGGRIGFNGDDLRVFNQQASGELNLGTAGTTKLTISSTGNVGIGAAPLQGKLDILNNGDYDAHTGHGLAINSSASNAFTSMYMGADDSIDAAYIQSAGRNTSFTTKKLLLNPNGGNVGVGTATPNAPFQIASTNKTINGTLSGSNLSVYTTDTQAADVGASIGLGGMSTTPAGFEFYGTMAGRKENSTNLDSSGYLAFYTQRVAVGHVERMRIDSLGVISIGPSTTSSEIYFNYNNTNNKGGLKIDYSTGELRLTAGESGNGYHQAFWTNGTEKMRIAADGDIFNTKSQSEANTFFGYASGAYTATGTGNTCFGYNVANNLTTGSNNTGVGRDVMIGTVTGNNNVGVGMSSNKTLTSGSNNVAIGVEALNSLTVGTANVCIGSAAGYGGDFGEAVFIGNLAGRYNSYGATVGIGNEALKNNGATENTGVGHRALINNTSGGGNTALGFRTLDTNTIQGYNTAIGSEALRNNNATGNTAIGRQAGLNISTGANNTLMGRNAGDSITDGIGNVALGFQAYQAGNNNYNTILGYQAAYSANMTNAVAIGFRAGYANTANSNVYIGSEAGRNNSSGTSNVFVGQDAGYANTTGAANTFIGTQAGIYQQGLYNTALGHLAMGGASGTGTGQQNTAIGHQAGRFITNANGTTFVGRNAGYNNTTGQYNTGIGVASLKTCTIGAANTAIGLNALYGITEGNNNTSVGLNAGYSVSTGHNNLLLGANAGRSTASGGLGEIISGDNQIQLGNNTNTSFKCKIALTVVSDKRDKTNFKEIPLGLDFVNKLKPTSFEFKKGRELTESDGIERYGFFAQDILELEGEKPVIINNDDSENLTYTSDNLIPVLVNAIQELKAEIELLKSK